MSERIEGVPDGWKLVRIGTPEEGEFFIDANGLPMQCIKMISKNLVIIRKIEKPKKYRPFANGEEFELFRDRWVRCKGTGSCFKIIEFQSDDLYIGRGSTLFSWTEAFKAIVFDDGSPFGIELSE